MERAHLVCDKLVELGDVSELGSTSHPCLPMLVLSKTASPHHSADSAAAWPNAGTTCNRFSQCVLQLPDSDCASGPSQRP